MMKMLASITFVALVTTTAVSPASAFSRSSTVSGTHGTYSANANTSCAGGTCSRSVNRTGPNGYFAHHSGSVSCSGGTCNSSGSKTRSNGRNTSHSGTISY